MAGYRKLGRTSSQRKALLRNQVTSLLYHGKIVTTEAKAKEIRKIAEHMIALAVKEKDNYETWCVGGVAFFDKRSDMGKVFPGFFQKSYWNPSFSCPVKESTKNQVDFLLKKIEAADREKRIFLYLNVDAIHYPNYFYLEGAVHDGLDSHAAALRYVDGELGRLFEGWKKKRGDTFVICCSDHGTCYGEDGCQFHGINHPAVNTIPYKHFFL